MDVVPVPQFLKIVKFRTFWLKKIFLSIFLDKTIPLELSLSITELFKKNGTVDGNLRVFWAPTRKKDQKVKKLRPDANSFHGHFR